MESLFNIGSLHFDLFSVIIIVLLIGAAVYGAIKGFLNSIIKFAQVFIVFGAATLLSKPLGDLLFNSGIGEAIVNDLTPGIEATNPVILGQLIEEGAEANFVTSALVEIEIPKFLASGLADEILKIIDLQGGQTLGRLLAGSIAYYGLIAISFVVITLIFTVLVIIIKKLTLKVNDMPVIGKVNRILGAVTFFATAYLILDGILFLISFIIVKDGTISEFIITTLHLNESNIYSLSKFMLENSIVRLIIKAL